VTERAEIFLGIIAIATLATAIVQIGVLVAAGLLARRLQRLVEQIERDVKPIFEHLNAMARDASRAAALATAQVERVDRLVGDVIQRLDHTMAALQSFVTGPLRNGVSLFGGVRALLGFIRDLRASRPAARSEDEDPLFI
jgi:hypothetical protein